MFLRVAVSLVGLLALGCTAFGQTNRVELSETELITPEELSLEGETDAGPALALSRPNVFSHIDGALLIHSLPALTLLDGRRFPISSELGRMGFSLLDVFPVAFLQSVEVEKAGSLPRYGSDGPGGVINLRSKRIYTGGEVGIFYGGSGGTYGRRDFQTYIIGGVGNEKFQITAGAAYHESRGSYPRR